MPKAKICGYEIHDSKRFRTYTFGVGLVSAAVFVLGSVAATNPSEALATGLATLAIFTTMTFAGLRAENRDAKAYAKNSLFAHPDNAQNAPAARMRL